MDNCARHLAFYRRAAEIVREVRSVRAAGGRHLVVSPRWAEEAEYLVATGAPAKSLVFVGPAADLLAVEEAFPEARVIADDLHGAMREAPRRCLTARLDTTGLLDSAVIDQARVVLAHGLSDGGLLLSRRPTCSPGSGFCVRCAPGNRRRSRSSWN